MANQLRSIFRLLKQSRKKTSLMGKVCHGAQWYQQGRPETWRIVNETSKYDPRKGTTKVTLLNEIPGVIQSNARSIN